MLSADRFAAVKVRRMERDGPAVQSSSVARAVKLPSLKRLSLAVKSRTFDGCSGQKPCRAGQAPLIFVSSHLLSAVLFILLVATEAYGEPLVEAWPNRGLRFDAPAFSPDERDALRRQILGCWQAPEGAVRSDGPAVELRVVLDPEGHPTSTEIRNSELMDLDPAFREVALSARQAVASCGRLELPPEKHETWRDLVLTFDPSGRGLWAEGLIPMDPDIRSNAEGLVISDAATSILRQLAPCWSVPAEVAGAEDLKVELRVELWPDGTLRAVEVVDPERFEGDWRAKAASDSALRAVERCSPLTGLPIRKYSSWRELRLTFDPSELLGK